MGFVTRYSKITPAKKWEPLIPLDVLTDGLKYKQQMFDKNAAIIEAQLTQGEMLASQIDNDEVKKQYQSDFNNLVTNINNNFSTADITKRDVMGSINEAGRSIAENTKYATALSMSRHFRDQEKLINESKTKDGGKFYNPSAEYIINKKAQQFKKASANDMMNVPMVEYAPYYDITDKKLKLIDKIKPSVEAELTNMGFDKSSDIYIQRVEKLTQDRVRTAMLDLYQNDSKALRQLQFDYEYNLDTNPVDVNTHAQKEFEKLNNDIKTLKEYEGKESNPDRKKQYSEAIAAIELNRNKLDQKYNKYLETKDVASYYGFGDFLNDRIDNDAATFSYSKVVQLSEDKYSLERMKHQFDMEEIQYRAKMKALYGDGDDIDPSGDGSELPAGGEGYSAGVMMFDDMLGRPNQNIPTSNIEAASLLGFEGDNAFTNDRFEMEIINSDNTGTGRKAIGRFTPTTKRYSSSTGNFYIYGYNNLEETTKLSDQDAKNRGLVYAGSSKTAAGTDVFYYKQPTRVKVDPSAQSTLTRNKEVYGNSKNGQVLMKAQNQTTAYFDGVKIGNSFQKVGYTFENPDATSFTSGPISNTITRLSPGGTYTKLANQITDPVKRNAALTLINGLRTELYNTYVLNGKSSMVADQALVPYKEQIKALLITLGKL